MLPISSRLPGHTLTFRKRTTQPTSRIQSLPSLPPSLRSPMQRESSMFVDHLNTIIIYWPPQWKKQPWKPPSVHQTTTMNGILCTGLPPEFMVPSPHNTVTHSALFFLLVFSLSSLFHHPLSLFLLSQRKSRNHHLSFVQSHEQGRTRAAIFRLLEDHGRLRQRYSALPRTGGLTKLHHERKHPGPSTPIFQLGPSSKARTRRQFLLPRPIGAKPPAIEQHFETSLLLI